MNTDWPFSSPPSVATFVSRFVLEGEPIIYAYRDWDDGAWQFLPRRITENSDARIVALKEVYKRDPSIAQVADLPPGWMAERSDASAPWVRRKNHPFPTFADNAFYLEDATEYQRLFPDQFPIPDAQTRENLKVGESVKLNFRFADEWSERGDNQVERMWVEIVEVDTENLRFRGILNNDPRLHSQIACGDELWFHPSHVFEIYREG